MTIKLFKNRNNSQTVVIDVEHFLINSKDLEINGLN
jgi:hypothetical protein